MCMLYLEINIYATSLSSLPLRQSLLSYALVGCQLHVHTIFVRCEIVILDGDLLKGSDQR